MGKPEAAIEKYLLTQATRRRYLCYKLTCPGHNGVPDRMLTTPIGVLFVELKKPGGKLSQIQKMQIPKMRKAGAEIHVIDTKAGVDELMQDLERRISAGTGLMNNQNPRVGIDDE